MTFDSFPPRIVREFRKMEFDATNSSFSDAEGNLLVYSNGLYIANHTNDTVPNGESINLDHTIDQSILYQGVLFLPQPGNDSIVYLIHEERSVSYLSTNVTKVFNCYFSTINLHSNDFNGSVVEKNKLLIHDTLCYGKLTATKHANGRDWWIVIPKFNKPVYFKFLLTPYGIDTFPPQTIGDSTFSNGGQAVFSPSGDKYNRINAPYETDMWLDIFDFDRCSGMFVNAQGFYKNEEAVYNSIGQRVLEKKYNMPVFNSEVNLGHLPNGIYVLSVFTVDGEEFNKTLVVLK